MNRVTLPAFLAIIMKLTVGFAVLFCLAILVMNEEATKKHDDFKRVAEIILTMTWEKENPHDIDLWLKQPNGQIVSFNNRETFEAHLERDDRGYRTDEYVDKNGVRQRFLDNSEVITVRSLEPGLYIVNVHFYSRYDTGNSYPITANVVVEGSKVNPEYRTFARRELKLKGVHDEQTAFSFKVTDALKVEDVQEIQRPFINERLGNSYSGGEQGRGAYDQ